ncbi:inositol monophosphatase family protein [Aestuariispira ectoiniformans]|uniref:inositol monophosphatase family protein n=1 Tax=Aestuariispira ectoiniformans TaxID=2775080 RepID=UPI00223BF535|nr:inositol monophosphatase [Aestuariispira ectoiniformans]
MFTKASEVTDLLVQASTEFVLPRFRALADQDVQEKSPGDLVTVADIDVEHFLNAQLPSLLTGSCVVGEEAYAKDPGILERLSNEEAVWLVDPVDGTVNFAHGRETFCVMVALVCKGETVMSWIHDPLSGTTAFAEKGSGAFWGDQRLRTPTPPSFSQLHGQINFAYFDHDMRSPLKTRANEAFGSLTRLGCAGHDFLAQARGTRHFAFYRRLWSWDHVPGTLLLQEAGGRVGLLDGARIHPADRVQGLITAANEELWFKIKDFLDNYL